MKRLICLILLFSLLLTGCTMVGEHIKEPVSFYYIQKNYQKNMDQVIVSELREASGHKDDLSYLLALYSMGPSSKELISLIPRNTTIIPTERSESSIELTLSENVLALTDANFTLASACIALTCMELLDVEQVTILCDDRSITIGEDTLLYADLIQNTQEEVQ